jgi:hypothetical protein
LLALAALGQAGSAALVPVAVTVATATAAAAQAVEVIVTPILLTALTLLAALGPLSRVAGLAGFALGTLPLSLLGLLGTIRPVRGVLRGGRRRGPRVRLSRLRLRCLGLSSGALDAPARCGLGLPGPLGRRRSLGQALAVLASLDGVNEIALAHLAGSGDAHARRQSLELSQFHGRKRSRPPRRCAGGLGDVKSGGV